MEEIYKSAGKSLIVFCLMFGIALINGSVLYLIYDHIHSIFPNAAINNIIAKDLKWWDSVCVTWIFGILIKPTSLINNKK